MSDATFIFGCLILCFGMPTGCPSAIYDVAKALREVAKAIRENKEGK